MQRECELLTQRFRGTRLQAQSAWFVDEWEFSTINGDRERLAFSGAA